MEIVFVPELCLQYSFCSSTSMIMLFGSDTTLRSRQGANSRTGNVEFVQNTIPENSSDLVLAGDVTVKTLRNVEWCEELFVIYGCFYLQRCPLYQKLKTKDCQYNLKLFV